MKAPGRVWFLYWPAALAAGGAALALIATSNHDKQPLVTGFLGLLAGWSFIGSGLVARARAPQNAVGRLMVGLGFAWFAGALSEANGSIPYTIGLAVGSFWAAILVHLLLAYPSGTLPGRTERVTVRTGYVLAGLGPLVTLLFDPKPQSDCHCPANAALVKHSHVLTTALNLIVDTGAVLVLGALVVLLARRWYTATAAVRRVLAPVLLSGLVASTLLIADVVVGAVSQRYARPVDWIAFAAFASVPLFFLLGVVQTRLARAGVGRLLVEVPEAPSREQTEEALRRALRDPTLQLAYWLPERRGYVDVDGAPFELPGEDEARVATTVEDVHGPIAAIVHDRAVLEEPELLDQVVAAARLGLAKDRSLQALQASERRTRALLDAIPDNMYRVARDGTYRDFNAHVPEDLVAPPDLLVGDSIPHALPKDVADVLMDGIERALATGAVVAVEYRVERTRGLRDVESRIVKSGEDEVVIIVRDITDRKAAESELERLGAELEARLDELQRERDFISAVLETAPTLVCVFDREGRIVTFNRECERLTGYSYEEVRARRITDVFVPPDEREGARLALEGVFEGRAPNDHENHWLTRSGERRLIAWANTILPDERGAPAFGVGTGVDITERKRAEEESRRLQAELQVRFEELQRERDFVSAVVNIAPSFYCVLDLEGRIVRFNDPLREMSGRADDESIRGQRFSAVLVAPEDAAEFDRLLTETPQSGTSPEHESHWLAESGERLLIAWSSASILDETARPVLLVCGADVTERKRQEEEIRASRARIVEVGDAERRRLERNLHDGAQQRLVSLSLGLRLARSKLGSDPDGAAELLDAATGELGQALEELRELARGIHPAILTDLGLEPALQSLVRRARVPVDVATSLEVRLPAPVEAAAFYVVSESLANVAKYAEASSVAVRISQSNGYAVVEVEDDGVGGADPKRGSGLRGLADRVEALEGRLGIVSRPGEGTRIRAEIPCA